AEPVRLDHVTSAMDVHPDEANGPGWYAIAFKSGRSPGLELGISGRLNLDTFDAEIETLEAEIDAGPDTIGTLPGPLGSLLEQHEVRGALEASGNATLNVRRPLGGTAKLAVRGRSLHLAVGEYRFPAESLLIDAGFAEGVLTVDPLEARLLGGTLRSEGRVELTAAGRPARGVCTLDGINLREALRRAPGDGPPRLAGILSGRLEALTLLETPRASLEGSGDAGVKDGRLLLLPGLTQLSNLINRGGFKDTGASNHRGSAVFSLGAAGATITRSEIVTNTLAARGTGLIGFDRTLDLRVNAGPLERIQSLLGPVGDLLGKVTDQLVKYTIKGTIDKPDVGVAPLGLD
ncbi:MAG: AsmA-like C-terminal region-containing protein, partial [Phycisphaerales bacterium]|nr:AsmA-like C-terminal region-containing protein [Phycisphaerales bacterium]